MRAVSYITLPDRAEARNIGSPAGAQMASKCFMCGTAITRGILCEKCDKPRSKGKPAEKVKPVTPPAPSAAAAPPHVRIGDLAGPPTTATRIRSRNYLLSLVPLSGGASGAVLVFRHADANGDAHASFATFVRETVFMPLRSLRESMSASRQTHPLFADAAAALDQVLSSLEMAPEVEEPAESRIPKVTEVVRNVANRFVPFADLK